MIPDAAVEAAYDKARVCKACGGYMDSHYFDCGAEVPDENPYRLTP